MKLKFLATMEGIRDGPDAGTSDSFVLGLEVTAGGHAVPPW